MGGKDSDLFQYFKMLLLKGFITLKKYVDDICGIINIMKDGSDLPCFYSFNYEELKRRFY
jgi:hypothetical protein